MNRLVVVAALLGAGLFPSLSFAGRVPGPGTVCDTVGAFRTDVYTEWFRGGEIATVVVSGDGDTDLDVFVYDEYGTLVAWDTGYTDDCLVVWRPRWTGPFRIKVVNRGSFYNRYVLATN